MTPKGLSRRLRSPARGILGNPAFGVLLWVLIGNWAIAAIKIAVGLWMGSAAVVSDGVHSFADGAANIVGIVGLMVAGRPAGQSHPYGYKKYETLAAVVISLILFVTGYEIIVEVIQRWRLGAPAARITIVSYLVMFLSLVVNSLMVWYEHRQAQELRSDILEADAIHSMTDIGMAFAVMASFVGVSLGYPQADYIMAIAIAFAVIYGAGFIVWKALKVLLDREMVSNDYLRTVAMGVVGVADVHRVRNRGRMDEIRVDLHIMVDADMPIRQAHQISHLVEDELRQKVTGVSEVLVHVEPLEENHHD